jgi:hypothetical protein
MISSQPTLFGEELTPVWCGDGTLISGWSLFDPKQGVTLCYYTAGFGQAARTSPDGRFWFTFAAKQNDSARLIARTVPEEQARQVANQLASGEVKLLVKPGTKVSLELDFTGPAGDAEYRNRLQTQLGHTLNSSGLIVADGQPIKLRISAKESDTGEKIEAAVTVKDDKTGKPETREVPRKRLTCETSFTDAEGKPLVPARNHVIELTDLKVTREAQDDPTAAATREQSKRLWDEFSRWMYQGLPPGHVARQGEKAIPWPRTVDLGEVKE